MFFDGGAVGFGGVALVLFPAVVGVLLVEGGHVLIAIGFGEDAGGGDAEVFAIAFDDAMVGEIVVGNEEFAINEQLLGRGLELGDGAVHGRVAGAEDIELVNFLGAATSYGPDESVGLDQLAGGEAVGRLELFAVVDQRVG